MDNKLFRTIEVNDKPKVNLYERFNLKRNPFPKKPSITIGSPDDRENGSIYLPDIRKKETSKFEKLMIPKEDGRNVNSISFLMDYATRRGRGIGKTTFLNHQKNRIMADFGYEVSKGSNILFAVYLSPISGGTYRKFWQISKLIIHALVEQEIIAQIMCRLRVFTKEIPDELLEKVTLENIIDTVGSNQWLGANKINHWNIESQIKHKLEDVGLNANLIENLVKFGHSPSEFRKYFLDSLTDSFWRKDENKILYDDLVKLFEISNFTKGLILFDELEKIIPYQNLLERRSFCDSIRYFFIDGNCENTRKSFFEVLFTIHPYLQELLNPHWLAAGLERFAPLGGEMASDNTVYFEPLVESSAIPLAEAFMEASRIANTDNKLFPFDEISLKEALKRTGGVPGKFLYFLNVTIEKAIELRWKNIGIEEIAKVLLPDIPKEPDAINNTEELPGPIVDLK